MTTSDPGTEAVALTPGDAGRCAVPGCPRRVGGIRVITVTPAGAGAETTIMVLCRKHAKVPHARLLRLLPALAELSLEATVRSPEGDHPAVKPIPPGLAEWKARKARAGGNAAAR